MSNKGLSEAVRLPLLGRIRLGVKKEEDDGSVSLLPTDYFVCPEEVKAVFGEKPRKLRIMFPTENSRQWTSQYLRCYSQTNELICRGDGETALSRVETTGSQSGSKDKIVSRLLEMPCNPDSCPCHRQGYCQQVMHLQFLLPDCPGFGVYQLNTGSFYSRSNVNGFLELMRGTCQRVSMIPLWLELVEQEVQPEGQPKTAYVLRLSCPHSLSEIQRFTRVPPGQALILPPPGSEAPEDLFPGQPLSEAAPRSSGHDRELIEIWTKVKSKIWHFGIQQHQIANWFERNYHIEAGLLDFDPPLPPKKFSAEMLSAFCQSIERYAGG